MREFSRSDQAVSVHLYGVREVMHYAEELRTNPAALAAARRCLELAEDAADNPEDLRALRAFLHSRYQRDPADYELVARSQVVAGDTCLYLGCGMAFVDDAQIGRILALKGNLEAWRYGAEGDSVLGTVARLRAPGGANG